MTLNSQNLNAETLETIAAEAITKLETSSRIDARRWIKGIRKAVSELETNPYWNYSEGALLIKSDTSDKIYTSNGTCFDDKGEPCKAFAKGHACYHRCAAKLLERYSEAA